MDIVTGATGHLGNALVRALIEQRRPVGALLRARSDTTCLQGLEIVRLAGDILDPVSMRRAFRCAEHVYHTAGYVSFGIGRAGQLHAVNVEGTRNVIAACCAAGVRRLVYVSSIEAFPLVGSEGPVTEERGFHPEQTMMEYGRTKAVASLELLDAVRMGHIDAVVVCPTGYIGPYDYRRSAMGRLVVDYVRRRIPLIVEGGFDFVDVRDVATGAILAADLGRSGECYILSGEYVRVRDIMRTLEACTGVPVPRLVLRPSVAKLFGAVAQVCSAVRGKQPRFTRSSVRILALDTRVSSEKARRELGYRPRPFSRTMEDTVAWFAEAGLLERAVSEPGA